ncbi:MAG: glycosyltransferase family 4 protein [Deltaproteobacteria bacterium]|nr:glycosyltransferase family 4 protein [Deltaproteobacteria bacterium]
MKFRTLDIIHAQGITAAFIGKFLKKIFRKKLIVNIHSVYDQKILSSVQVRFVSWILNGADHVFVLSKAIWAQHVNYFKILPERISRFRYWLDLSIFHPIASGQKPIASWQGKFVVLFVGRLLSIKGVDLLFEMVEKLPSDIYIAMVGEGSRRAELEHKSKAFSQVMFVGPVRNQDLPAYLWSADLLIMPSLYKEGYGRVNMEAQACGLPILASNRGGIGEVVQEGGILVEPTVQNFIEKVLELKNNPQKLADLRQKAIRFAEANFSEKNIEVFENYYNQL